MGPGCFYPGNPDHRARALVLYLASMGPGCFYPGNPDHRARALLLDLASMGPGCFYPGNKEPAGTPREACKLQWGRDVSIPEIRITAPVRWCFTWLQWGRDVSIPEIRITAPVRCCLTWLQWGRDVSIPEIKSLPERQERRASFNGAGMFLSRKSLRDIAGTRGLAASMGPGCFYPGNTEIGRAHV